MAFNDKKIAPMSNNGRASDIPMLWVYDNIAGDTVTAITTAGFIPNDYGVTPRDTVRVYAAAGSYAEYIASDSSGLVKLTAMS